MNNAKTFKDFLDKCYELYPNDAAIYRDVDDYDTFGDLYKKTKYFATYLLKKPVRICAILMILSIGSV